VPVLDIDIICDCFPVAFMSKLVLGASLRQFGISMIEECCFAFRDSIPRCFRGGERFGQITT